MERPQVLDSVDADRLRAALNIAAPFVPSGPLVPVGSGFYSFVFETAGWIVRVARTADAKERHDFEVGVLPALAPFLPVAIPHPRVALPPGGDFPFGACAYPALPGRAMRASDGTGTTGEEIAGQLGTALAALHTIPRRDAPAAVPRSHLKHLEWLYETTIEGLRPRLALTEARRVESWWQAFLGSGVPRWPRRTLVHGDPWFENLTADDSGLAGILDWEFLSWADPAMDIGSTLEMGEQFFRRTLATYKARTLVDSSLERRSRQLFAARTFYGIRFAMDRDDEAEWVDSLAKLRASAILA